MRAAEQAITTTSLRHMSLDAYQRATEHIRMQAAGDAQ
jgi:hypothetical protein